MTSVRDDLYIKNAISVALKSFNTAEMTLVVDGRYFMFRSKTVYAELVGTQLEFFIREKKIDSNGKTLSMAEKIYVTADVLPKLTEAVIKRTLGTYTSEFNFNASYMRVDVDSEMGLVIIESVLYKIARTMITTNQKNQDLRIGDDRVPYHSLVPLLTEFRKQSYSNYYKFIYNKLMRRIVNRCYKKVPFYNTMRAFVPVIIQYDYVYNPLMDDPDNTLFMHTRLMQTAVSNSREVVVNNKLRCYMLTHKEICQALNLKRFMRFTPEFLYRVVVGMMRPDLEDFPSKSRKVYVRSSASEVIPGYKACYSVADFEELLTNLAGMASKISSEEERKKIEKELEVLNGYVNIDSLFYEVDKERGVLSRIGALPVDGSITTELLYSIISDCELLMEVQNE